MIELPRRPPVPIPAIHPMPEYLAEKELKLQYEDMKTIFQVPWMGVVTMAYAYYPRFYRTLWQGVRPLCMSAPYVNACLELRQSTEQRVTTLNPPPIVDQLGEMGYAAREITQIRDTVDVFSHGNFLYLLLATIVRYLLEGGELKEATEAPAFQGQHAPATATPFVLMEAHHAEQPIQALYADIRTTLKLPFVNTDYRAFARWPSYFTLAWGSLREVVNTSEYQAITQSIHEQALAYVQALPNPGKLTGDILRTAAEQDADREEIVEMCRLFQWLLPGLVTNVAFFRHQLLA